MRERMDRMVSAGFVGKARSDRHVRDRRLPIELSVGGRDEREQ